MITGNEVLKFTDFRTFLKAHYEDMKAANPRWSLGVWARKLDLSATASLSMVLNGQRHPGPQMIKSLVEYFKFTDPKKKQYFLDLIRLEKTKKDPEVRTLLLEKLERQHPKGHFRAISADQFAAISKWHHYAIREMTGLRDFQEDSVWIQKKLLHAVSAGEIEKSIRRMVELGMLVRDEEGRLRSSNETIETPSDVLDEGLRRFHEQMTDQARAAIREVKVQDREIRGATFTIRKEALPLAKEKIRAFMSEMLELLEAPVGEGEETYQMNVQFFPLTQSKVQRKKEM